MQKGVFSTVLSERGRGNRMDHLDPKKTNTTKDNER